MDPNIQYGGNSLPTSTSTSTSTPTPSPDIINLKLNDNSNFPNMFSILMTISIVSIILEWDIMSLNHLKMI